MPHIYMPHTFVHPLHMPHTLLCICVFLEALHVVGGCVGTPTLYHPCLGCLPFNYTPHTQSLVSCASECFRDISMLCGHSLLSLRVWGCSPISWGVGGHQHLRCLYAPSCTFSVVHYVSCFDYGSNCYSSCYSGIFWPVIIDSGSFPDRVSSKLGSAWHGSTTTLDAERLWRCSWLSFYATAATSIFNASFSLCQLCYGFSTGRFLFQS